jgi:hypothetical protein
MRFPVDPKAPSVGTWRGWGKIFLLRSRRRVGLDPSERLHSSVEAARKDAPIPASGWRAMFSRT